MDGWLIGCWLKMNGWMSGRLGKEEKKFNKDSLN
jgi:hypothetical protein